MNLKNQKNAVSKSLTSTLVKYNEFAPCDTILPQPTQPATLKSKCLNPKQGFRTTFEKVSYFTRNLCPWTAIAGEPWGRPEKPYQILIEN